MSAVGHPCPKQCLLIFKSIVLSAVNPIATSTRWCNISRVWYVQFITKIYWRFNFTHQPTTYEIIGQFDYCTSNEIESMTLAIEVIFWRLWYWILVLINSEFISIQTLITLIWLTIKNLMIIHIHIVYIYCIRLICNDWHYLIEYFAHSDINQILIVIE